MNSLWQDLRCGARMSLKQPGFTLIAALTPALRRKSFNLLCLLLAATLTVNFTVVRGQEPALNLKLAEQYFREAQELCERDRGRLWGVLDVSGGVLMSRAGGRIARLQVAAPSALDVRPLQGNGWKLEMKEGWGLVRGDRPGDFVLRKMQ